MGKSCQTLYVKLFILNSSSAPEDIKYINSLVKWVQNESEET